MQVVKNIALFGTLILGGCGQFEGRKSSGGDSAPATTQAAPRASVGVMATYYASDATAPTCDDTVARALIYIAETKAFEYCDGTTWQVIDLSPPAQSPTPTPTPIPVVTAPVKILLSIVYHLGTVAQGDSSTSDFVAIMYMPTKVSTIQMTEDDFNAAVAAGLQCGLSTVNPTIYTCQYTSTNANCSDVDTDIVCTKPTITDKGDSF